VSAHTSTLWPVVNQLLGIVQSDHELQSIAKRLELTRDPGLDSRQRSTLLAGLQQRAMNVPALSRLSRDELTASYDLAYDELIGISILGPLWRDDSVSEILVDAWNRIYIERAGRLEQTPITFRDHEHALTVARNLALVTSDRAVSATNPAVTAEVAGARVAFTVGKIVKSGIALSIRKFGRLMDAAGLLAAGSYSTEMRDFLADCVGVRANILVAGGTGTGKTTMINALSGFIGRDERVITIEDAFELQLNIPYWVQLQTKEAASADDEVRVSLADLLKHTLRMRPDRIIVGEIREPDGAVVMLQAANTGHSGTMTTIHADTPIQALNYRLAYLARTGARMEQDVAAAEVATAINLIVQISRERGRRFVRDISVVDITCLEGARIQPRQVFSGHLDEDGTPVFTRTGGVEDGTALAALLDSAGLLDRWKATPS
jgi:pilus assembly protein CpaF